MADVHEWNRRIIAEFRANDGKVGGRYENMPLLLLHHYGAKSGRERVNPLAYRRTGDAVAIFASKGGAATNPDWYHNLLAHPEVTVEIGAESYAVRARVASGEERERIWAAQVEAFPYFSKYEQTPNGRRIPIIVLEPA
jgi:deazaflavin-dependent oxidoreductase (nitroreductase family)